jgi:hypothetical protein
VAVNRPAPEKLLDWQTAILGSDLSPTTRLVLLTLSIRMKWRELSCYPSLDTLQNDTALSRGTLCKHLGIAITGGWLTKDQQGSLGQGWRQNLYRARLPDDRLAGAEGGSAGEPPSGPEVVHLAAEGSSAHAQKVVREVDSNKPLNKESNSAGADAREPKAAPAPAENDLQDGATATEIIASPAIGPDALRAWTEVRRGMRAELGEATYATWIAPLRLEAISPDFVLSAPGKFHRDRVISLHEAALRHRLYAAFGAERPIEWRVHPAAPLSTPSTRDGSAWT